MMINNARVTIEAGMVPKFKPPLAIDYNDTPEAILAQIMDAIEQSRDYMMKGAHHWKTESV